MLRLALLALLAVSSAASAVVIRHDVEDAAYRIPAAEFPALVDMPGEGQGVLIAPQWVLTAAHTIAHPATLGHVELNGRRRAVDRVVVHPGYATPPQSMIDQALASGEGVLLVAFLATTDDLALVSLVEPVDDVEPVGLYRGRDEHGQTVRIIGKGATGDGATGHDRRGPNRTQLRRAYNTVSSAHERWFCYVFDAPPAGLPLEGTTGNGDSGGPVLIQAGGQWQLAGLAAWKFVPGDIRTARPGRYGQTSCNVRLGHYLAWIDLMTGAAPADED
ncbi:MAG: trypsin-like serine protease [Xanthomonadales bacterium]|nr:trypsin-like serine protease [Xanthomonadales bacterium]